MKKMNRLVLVFVLLILASIAAVADTIAIVGGRIVIGDGTTIERGTVIIEDGNITAVGSELAVPDGARVIDASGLWVCPGMIDPYTSIGLVEVGAARMTNDSNEATQTTTPQLRAADAINPDSTVIPVTRIGGVTTVLVSPGAGNPVNGQAAIIDLLGRTVDEMLIAENAAQVFSLSNRVRRQSSYPSTRIGIMALLRQTLYDARQYADKKSARENGDEETEGNSKPGSIDLRYGALIPVLEGELPVIAAAQTIQEIGMALSLAKEFELKLVLLSPAHSWKMLEEIKQSGTPILLSNTYNIPSETDTFDRYFSLAATLHEAGILFAFTTGSAHSVRTLRTDAAKAVAYGLPEDEAIKALTLNPAKILGIDEQYGSIAPGKVANIALWNGNPLQIRNKVVRLFIRGREIPLVSRQEMLRDKFKNIGVEK